MTDGPFFTEPHADALMGSMLGLTGELLLVSARQRRLANGGTDLDAPLDEPERAWVAQEADRLVAAWLAPFTARPAEATDAA